MPGSSTCHHETLAHNEIAHIERCVHCGCISVHLGSMTVRLDDASMEALWAVLGDAAIELRSRHALHAENDLERGLS